MDYLADRTKQANKGEQNEVSVTNLVKRFIKNQDKQCVLDIKCLNIRQSTAMKSIDTWLNVEF